MFKNSIFKIVIGITVLIQLAHDFKWTKENSILEAFLSMDETKKFGIAAVAAVVVSELSSSMEKLRVHLKSAGEESFIVNFLAFIDRSFSGIFSFARRK